MSFDVYAKTVDIIDNNKQTDQDKLAFTQIEHNHGDNPTKLQIIACNRCTMDTADAGIKQKLLDIQTKNTMVSTANVDGVQRTYQVERIVIQRGLFDSAIGTEISWKAI